MTKAVWRPTMSSDVVFELVDVLEHTKRTTGLSQNLREFLKKLDSLAYDIGKGNRSPAYVATGVREGNKITLESLGGGDAQDNPIRNLSAIPVSIPTKPISTSGELTPEQEDELERENNRMLAEFAAQGNENVVLEDRRKVPREGNDDSSDSSLFNSLN